MDEIDDIQKIADNLGMMRLMEENARLREALERVEWVEEERGEKFCPWCGNYWRSGHASNCRRQAALGITKS